MVFRGVCNSSLKLPSDIQRKGLQRQNAFLTWYSQNASWMVRAAALSTARFLYTALRAIIPRAAAWIAMAAIVRMSSSVSPSSAKLSPATLPPERMLRGRREESPPCCRRERRDVPVAPVRRLPEEVVEATERADRAPGATKGLRRRSPVPPELCSWAASASEVNAQPGATVVGDALGAQGSSGAAPGGAFSITRQLSTPYAAPRPGEAVAKEPVMLKSAPADSSSAPSSMRPGLPPRDLRPGLPVRDELRELAAEPLDLTTDVATPRSLAYMSLWAESDETTEAVSCA